MADRKPKPDLRYVTTDNSGWLRVKTEPNGAIVPLPQYIKVVFEKRDKKRDYFKIEEGLYSGKKASVSQKSEKLSWLGKPRPQYRGPVSLTFKIGEKKLITPVGTLNAKTDDNNPIPTGQYPIQLPAFPHSLGSTYLSQASKALTWFYLGVGKAIRNRDDRYLHVGRISAGCVTVTDISKWDRLYALLILSRSAGGKNVGTITVQN